MSDSIFWFRRDLRLEDNAGLFHALKAGPSVRPLFIFDSQILGRLKNSADPRVTFLHDRLKSLQESLRVQGAELEVYSGQPLEVYKKILADRKVKRVFTNHDEEPAALKRDTQIKDLCRQSGVEFLTFKDQVVFERDEVLTDARRPYTVYTPYKKKWLASLSPFYLQSYPVEKYFENFKKVARPRPMPSLKEIGFVRADSELFPSARLSLAVLKHYAEKRDFPAIRGTSRMGLHLRFGTRSVRDLAREGKKHSPVWLSELVWREFFMQILFHFPHVEKASFRPEYDKVEWRSKKSEFERWCDGETGYPFVDAGMRELNATGFMHNRARMITASFLTKHLLHHWYDGERYFAAKLLDYDLAANNGNWQWAAGTGCDAAPYFRIFNPEMQMRRFDPEGAYVKKWVPEWGTSRYPKPMVDHAEARARALRAFHKALKGKSK